MHGFWQLQLNQNLGTEEPLLALLTRYFIICESVSFPGPVLNGIVSSIMFDVKEKKNKNHRMTIFAKIYQNYLI